MQTKILLILTGAGMCRLKILLTITGVGTGQAENTTAIDLGRACAD